MKATSDSMCVCMYVCMYVCMLVCLSECACDGVSKYGYEKGYIQVTFLRVASIGITINHCALQKPAIANIIPNKLTIKIQTQTITSK